MANTPRDHLKTHLANGVKHYITYDVSNRMEFIYEAPADAIHGAPCLVTQYAYDGGSTRIEKSKETTGTWDSSWDL
jgi:hypothetical protein